MKRLLGARITKDQSRDTGMAMVLLLIILHIVLKQEKLVVGALALQVVNMTVPGVFRPVAVVWLGLSHIVGMVMSKILLSIVFFAVVVPIGMLRTFLGKDSLKLRVFKAGDESVMVVRNHTFAGRDIEKPY